MPFLSLWWRMFHSFRGLWESRWLRGPGLDGIELIIYFLPLKATHSCRPWRGWGWIGKTPMTSSTTESIQAVCSRLKGSRFYPQWESSSKELGGSSFFTKGTDRKTTRIQRKRSAIYGMRERAANSAYLKGGRRTLFERQEEEFFELFW